MPATGKGREPSAKEIRLVIAASSAGTIFEWYDFFIYGTLAALIGKAFFPSGNETLELLLVWAGFAVGFGFRPLGAVLFGFSGDRLGRKYTFLVTVTLMGIATAGVGMIPSAATIGIAVHGSVRRPGSRGESPRGGRKKGITAWKNPDYSEWPGEGRTIAPGWASWVGTVNEP